MDKNTKKFSINDIQMFREDEDIDFMHVKIYALGDGNNSHHNPISTEVLDRDKNSILGKLLIAKFDKYSNDVTTHVPDQQIIGYVPPNQEVKLEEKDGKNFITVDGLVSKIYATEIVNMFRETIAQREVSCEFSCQESQDEDDNGDIPILAFSIHGITFLGLKYHASSTGAEVKVIKFAERLTEETSLKSLAEKRMKKLEDEKLVSHPMNKSKDAVDMGEWNVDKARNDLVKEKNYKTIAKSASLDLKEGWEDRNKTALGYMVMNLKNGEWVYNAKALSSARGYASGARGAEENKEIYNKVVEIEKKLGLYKEESMTEDIKKLSDKDTEDIVMEKTVEDEKEKKVEKPEEKKEMGCGEDKKFALCNYADVEAMSALFADESDVYKSFADKIMKEMSAEDIVKGFVAVTKERDSMKAEKDKAEKDKTEKKFMSIMNEYKENLSTDNFVKLYEEGKALKFDDLDGFVNKIKSFAEEKKETKEDEFMKFAGANNEHIDEPKDVFDKISRK